MINQEWQQSLNTETHFCKVCKSLVVTSQTDMTGGPNGTVIQRGFTWLVGSGGGSQQQQISDKL
jgi:hypothetical protein